MKIIIKVRFFSIRKVEFFKIRGSWQRKPKMWMMNKKEGYVFMK
jgi:hypothetical protein